MVAEPDAVAVVQAAAQVLMVVPRPWPHSATLYAQRSLKAARPPRRLQANRTKMVPTYSQFRGQLFHRIIHIVIHSARYALVVERLRRAAAISELSSLLPLSSGVSSKSSACRRGGAGKRLACGLSMR